MVLFTCWLLRLPSYSYNLPRIQQLPSELKESTISEFIQVLNCFLFSMPVFCLPSGMWFILTASLDPLKPVDASILSVNLALPKLPWTSHFSTFLKQTPSNPTHVSFHSADLPLVTLAKHDHSVLCIAHSTLTSSYNYLPMDWTLLSLRN